jgi:hypothetical protein
LAPGLTNLTTNTGLVPVVCTRGLICQVEQYVAGIKYTTPLIGSMDVTAEVMNQQQLNDPNFYENLVSNYYYILKKQTESGAKSEEVFYKP